MLHKALIATSGMGKTLSKIFLKLPASYIYLSKFLLYLWSKATTHKIPHSLSLYGFCLHFK